MYEKLLIFAFVDIFGANKLQEVFHAIHIHRMQSYASAHIPTVLQTNITQDKIDNNTYGLGSSTIHTVLVLLIEKKYTRTQFKKITHEPFL